MVVFFLFYETMLKTKLKFKINDFIPDSKITLLNNNEIFGYKAFN